MRCLCIHLAVKHLLIITFISGPTLSNALASTPTSTRRRFTVAAEGVFGFMEVFVKDGAQFLAVEMKGFDKNVSTVELSFRDMPVLHGQEPCSVLLERPKVYVNSSIVLQVSNGSAKTTDPVLLPTTPSVLSEISSILLYVPGGRGLSVCTNIIPKSDVYVARFYGPYLGGDIYLFLQADGQLNVLSELINIEGVEASLKWVLKKRWWKARKDSEEPRYESCMTSAESAAPWNPAVGGTELQPGFAQVQKVQLSYPAEDLGEAVVIVHKLLSDEDDSNSMTVVGCSRLSRLLPYKDDDVTAKIASNSINFEQLSPFHPLYVTSSSFSMPPFDIYPSFTSKCNELNMLRPVVRSVTQFGIEQPTSFVSTEVTLYGTLSILFHTLKVTDWARRPECVPIKPSRYVVGQAQFFYPLVGTVQFLQAASQTDGVVVIVPELRHLYDLSQTRDMFWQVFEKPTGLTVHEMACDAKNELFNPTDAQGAFCEEPFRTCAIGRLTEKLGFLQFHGSNASEPIRRLFTTTQTPLFGPYGILNRTLQIDFGLAQACSSILLVEPAFADMDCHSTSSAPSSWRPGSSEQEVYVVATFAELFNGTITMVQRGNSIIDPLFMQSTEIHANFTGLPTGEQLEIEIVDDDNSTKRTCDEMKLFNPFYIDIDKANYKSLCADSQDSCAVGDLKEKFGIIGFPFSKSGCARCVPLAGPYSAQSKIIRIRSAKDPKKVACATLKVVSGVMGELVADPDVDLQKIYETIMEKIGIHKYQFRLKYNGKTNGTRKCSKYQFHYYDYENADVLAWNSTAMKSLKLQILNRISEKDCFASLAANAVASTVLVMLCSSILMIQYH